MNKTIRKKLVIGIGLLFGLVIFYQLLLDPIATTFNITASTERIEIYTLDENGSQLNLYEVDIFDSNLNPIFKKFNGSLRLNKGAEVTVERTAFGPAILIFKASKNHMVGTLFNENGSFVKHTGHYLQIFINDLKSRADNGQTIILPIDGKVNLGRSVDFETFDESTAVLRSGEINMTGSSTFSDSFEAGTTKLCLGDQIVFDDQSNKAFGFITINEQPGMQAAYRVIADQATILKPGPKVKSSGFTIHATLLNRLLKASLFQFVSLFFAAAVALTTMITFFKENKGFNLRSWK